MSLDPLEIKATRWLFSFLPERPVIVDIGSNKGAWADLILEEYGDRATVHLFEPNELLLNYTRVKYDARENITYHSEAVGNFDGMEIMDMFTDKHCGLSGLYHNPKWEYLKPKRVGVAITTIDDTFSAPIDFLKIDVEGAEGDVLQGASGLFNAAMIGIAQIEYSEHWKLTKWTMRDIIGWLNMLEYSCYEYQEDRGFVKLSLDTFVEDYRFTNFYITRYSLTNLSHGWNKPFVENTEGLRPGFVLELGACEGLTSRYICEHLLTGPDARMIAVDPLQDYYITPNDMPEMKDQYYRFLANTKGLPVTLIRKESQAAYDDLKDFRFDLIFVDANHWEEPVYQDAVMSLKLIKPGGYILFDDYDGWGDGATGRGIDRFLHEYAGALRVIKKNYQVLIQKL